jgi:predicted SAM-dependent methyltransferase
VYECTKALIRRQFDPNWARCYFVGDALDIGAGGDGLSRQRDRWPRLTSVRDWDQGDGDGQALNGIEPASFDVVHSSHSLEHMADPYAALARWWEVLKPGGHLVLLVPDEDMYEQGVWPSQHNEDHKYTFTLWKHESWCEDSVDLLTAIMDLGPDVEILEARTLHGSYVWEAPSGMDQTLGFGESACEVVVRKRLPDEVAKGGRLR